MEDQKNVFSLFELGLTYFPNHETSDCPFGGGVYDIMGELGREPYAGDSYKSHCLDLPA